jgi:hypothetical protein
VFIEVATGEKRNAPCLEVSGAMLWLAAAARLSIGRISPSVRAYRKLLPAAAGAECRRYRCAPQAGHIAQRSERLFRETCARCDVRIARVGQRHEPDPNIIAIADLLLAQPDEARNEQGRTRKQRDRSATCAPMRILRKRS